MKLVFGLGNPEKKYDGTRHNVGFWVLDELAKEWDVRFTLANKFKALVAETMINGEKVMLVKPQTYYNEVGQSARALLDFYTLEPKDILVVHDDLALPLGTLRTRPGGSSGGNNGLKSLEAHIGAETARLRVGTWSEDHHGKDKVGVVLGKLTANEQASLTTRRAKLTEVIEAFIAGKFEHTTHVAE